MAVKIIGRLEGSINNFISRCETTIESEQGKGEPDNALIALLCDAVRLAREYVEWAGIIK